MKRHLSIALGACAIVFATIGLWLWNRSPGDGDTSVVIEGYYETRSHEAGKPSGGSIDGAMGDASQTPSRGRSPSDGGSSNGSRDNVDRVDGARPVGGNPKTGPGGSANGSAGTPSAKSTGAGTHRVGATNAGAGSTADSGSAKKTFRPRQFAESQRELFGELTDQIAHVAEELSFEEPQLFYYHEMLFEFGPRFLEFQSSLGAPEPPAKLIELREEFDRRVLEGLAPEQRERFSALSPETRYPPIAPD